MTPEQLTLGEALRDEGIAKVWGGTDNAWRDAALAAIRRLVDLGREFTSEDVRERAGDPPKPNSMGAAFQWASRAGLICQVGWRKAERSKMHATDLRVWKGVP